MRIKVIRPIRLFLYATLCMLAACTDNLRLERSDAERSSVGATRGENFAFVEKEDVLEMTESGCMSGCPAYSTKVLGDGRYEFKENFPKKDISFFGVINPEKMKALRDLFGTINFVEMSVPHLDCKGGYGTEYSSVTIRIHSKTVSHEIFHDHGCKGFSGEEELIRFEGKIKEILEIQEKL